MSAEASEPPEQPETGDERDPLWRPRNGRGKWVTSLTTIERDRKAAELQVQGLSLDAIAEQLGMADRSVAHKAVRRARLAAAMEDPTTTERRLDQLEELRTVREAAHKLLRNPLPAISRTGKVVISEDTGEVVPDGQIILGALAAITKANERVAKLTGTESARRTVAITGHSDATVEEIRACMAAWQPARVREAIEQAHAELEAKTAIPGTIDDAPPDE